MRHNGDWCFLLNKGKLQDFGGKKKKTEKGDESFEECAWRECFEESGIKQEDVIEELHVFDKQSYGVIVVATNKAPHAKEPDTSIVRYANYNEARRTGNLVGRLFIKGFEYKLRDFEGTPPKQPKIIKSPGFIMDMPCEVDTSNQTTEVTTEMKRTTPRTNPRTTRSSFQTSRKRPPSIMDMPRYVDCSMAGSYIKKKPAFIGIRSGLNYA